MRTVARELCAAWEDNQTRRDHFPKRRTLLAYLIDRVRHLVIRSGRGYLSSCQFFVYPLSGHLFIVFADTESFPSTHDDVESRTHRHHFLHCRKKSHSKTCVSLLGKQFFCGRRLWCEISIRTIVDYVYVVAHDSVCICRDYCASKYGALGLHESLAVELRALGKNGIQLTNICPFLSIPACSKEPKLGIPSVVGLE